MPWQMINTPQAIVREVHDGLLITLTVGAAKDTIGSDRVYLERLGEALGPAITAYQSTGSASFVLDTIRDVMGPEWKPTGDWAEYIEAVKGLTAGLAGK